MSENEERTYPAVSRPRKGNPVKSMAIEIFELANKVKDENFDNVHVLAKIQVLANNIVFECEKEAW